MRAVSEARDEEPEEEETRRRSSTNMVKDRQKASVINMQMAVEQEARDHNLSLLDKPTINHATWQTAEEAKLEQQDPRASTGLISSASGDVQGKKIRLRLRA